MRWARGLVLFWLTVLIGLAASAQAPNPMDALKAKLGQSDPELEKVKACIGPMGVAKMTALKIKAQDVENQITMYCTLRQEQEAKDYAARQFRILLEDPTVAELEKCDAAQADAYRKRVNAIKPGC